MWTRWGQLNNAAETLADTLRTTPSATPQALHPSPENQTPIPVRPEIRSVPDVPPTQSDRDIFERERSRREQLAKDAELARSLSEKQPRANGSDWGSDPEPDDQRDREWNARRRPRVENRVSGNESASDKEERPYTRVGGALIPPLEKFIETFTGQRKGGLRGLVWHFQPHNQRSCSDKPARKATSAACIPQRFCAGHRQPDGKGPGTRLNVGGGPQTAQEDVQLQYRRLPRGREKVPSSDWRRYQVLFDSVEKGGG